MTDLTCDHCDRQFENDDRFMELQPGHFMYAHGEITRDNIGYRVHVECLEAFAEEL